MTSTTPTAMALVSAVSQRYQEVSFRKEVWCWPLGSHLKPFPAVRVMEESHVAGVFLTRAWDRGLFAPGVKPGLTLASGPCGREADQLKYATAPSTAAEIWQPQRSPSLSPQAVTPVTPVRRVIDTERAFCRFFTWPLKDPARIPPRSFVQAC